MLTKEEILKYKALYKRKFGVELTMLEATKKAYELFNLMKLLTTKNTVDNYTKN